MITLIYSPEDWYVAEIVYKALIRSFTKSQVQRLLQSQLKNIKTSGIFVFIHPKNISVNSLPEKSKVILFGKIESCLADELNIQITDIPDHYFSENAIIHFNSEPTFQFPISERPLVRFDFPNEWNNLGFGAVRTNGSIWSLAHIVESQQAIATITENTKKTAYITQHDFKDKSVIWINRAVGLVDSVNWSFIEYFVSAHRFDELVSLPYLLDIPANTSAIATMRLDCDEDIASAKPLFDAYHALGVPFSLAVKTSLSITDKDHQLLSDVKKSGGALLSHSVNHKVAWGQDYVDAFSEAYLSKQFLENTYDRVDFAVSPFHSNTIYSVKAMEDAGYRGFVGGIIANDPEYLIARGGAVPFAEKIVSHSQQCMMHGECLLKENDPLRIYKMAFDQAHKSKTFFGFLDHPFSPRYQYGWETEEQRIAAHKDLIQYMREKTDVLFVNENQCLAFMMDKSNAEINYQPNHMPTVRINGERQSEFFMAISLNNQVYDTCHVI